MYYPELLELINKTGSSDAINKLDKYFAFLPNRSEYVITVSNVSSKLELEYSIVELLLEYIYNMGLLERVYIIKCPNCETELSVVTKSELVDEVVKNNYCLRCKEDINISEEDIYIGYKLLKQPNLDSSDIEKETQKLLGDIKINNEQETLAKLFEKHKENPHDFFYNPSSEDRKLMKRLYRDLDKEYNTTKEKGDSLEGLIKILFNLCSGIKATTIIRSATNQFDCSVRNDFCIPLTVYKELGSLFKAEAKNEPNKTPGNSYYHKLFGIVNNSKSSTEQGVGILFSRKPVASTCNKLAREYFLKSNVIIINLNNNDLEDIIIKKENFLDIIQEKIQYIKNNIVTSPKEHKLYRKF